MLELETKYLSLTKDLVLTREKELNEIALRFCDKLFEKGLAQLEQNFSQQRAHNAVKHEKEIDFTKRTLALEEAELLKQQEVDRKSIPKKIKGDKKKRLAEDNKRIQVLTRNEKKNFLNQVFYVSLTQIGPKLQFWR